MCLSGCPSPSYTCAGIEKLRFKPAYNPYTEPSMEVFSYHDGEGRVVWVGRVAGPTAAGGAGV